MKTIQPRTHVLILSYNHPGITSKCVESAFCHFENHQITLVHNGSRLENIDQLKSAFPGVEHLEIESNLGFSGGANRGINHAFKNIALENVLFLSNDTKLEVWDFQPPKSERYLLAPRVELRETGRVASLGGSVCLWRGQISHNEGDQTPKGKFFVPGAAFILNRRAWERLSGFDEKLGSYWEDVDLSLRAKELNINLGITEKVVVKHSVAKTTGGDPYYTLYSFHRNRRRVVFRHGNGFQRAVFSLVYTASSLGKLFKFMRKRDFNRVKLLLKAIVS